MKLFAALLLLAPLGVSAFGPAKQPKTVSTSPPALHAALSPKPEQSSMFNAMGNIWNREVASAFAGSEQDVVIEPDFTLAWLFALSGAFIYFNNLDPSCFNAGQVIPTGDPGLFPGIFAFLHVWFGAFLADRAMRVRVVFTEDRLVMKDVYDAKSGNKLEGGEMSLREKNYVLGGADGWKYENFINWGFFPSVHMPVLTYFKEDQTPPEKWNVGPGAYDWRNNGMVHFFPAFGNSFQIQREFEKHNLSRVDSSKNKGK
mmetsp:Transcript_34071/g.74952  ORF Transcript_34071/g.74952 Transcript_34071/m.74952 type:complete len:258 (+) Transcript_34071:136-909(+)